jgi:hypothetical protein
MIPPRRIKMPSSPSATVTYSASDARIISTEPELCDALLSCAPLGDMQTKKLKAADILRVRAAIR